MPKLCAHTKCQWVVAIVSIISSRSESRQTRSLILCNALQSMLSDVFLSFGMRLLFTFQWANGFLFIGPPYIIYVIHVCFLYENGVGIHITHYTSRTHSDWCMCACTSKRAKNRWQQHLYTYYPNIHILLFAAQNETKLFYPWHVKTYFFIKWDK